jgi:hypothetical protein
MEVNESRSSLLSEESEKICFAEVVESNLHSFTAQCWKWDNFARYGSLVQVESDGNDILGCVTQVQTGSIDPARYPFTYQKTEQELLNEQPQIFEFLRTVFNVQILGYVDKKQNKICYLLPSTPCKIHSFVKECSCDVIQKFFKEPLYLHVLFSSPNQNSNPDELLLAILNGLAYEKILTQTLLDDFCQTFSLLTGNDYRRLKLFLKRVEKTVP